MTVLRSNNMAILIVAFALLLPGCSTTPDYVRKYAKETFRYDLPVDLSPIRCGTYSLNKERFEDLVMLSVNETAFHSLWLGSRPGSCKRVEADLAGDRVSLWTVTQIWNLPEVINGLAGGLGLFPSTEELEIREQRDPHFRPWLYTLASTVEIPYPDIDSDLSFGYLKSMITSGKEIVVTIILFGDSQEKWFVHTLSVSLLNGTICLKQKPVVLFKPSRKDLAFYRSPRSAMSLPFPDGTGRILKFNYLTSFCDCCSRFSMRVYDATGKYFWENTDSIYGNFWTVIFDLDGIGPPEIFVFREEHGSMRVLVFSSEGT